MRVGFPWNIWWEFAGRHNAESGCDWLTGEEVRELIALDECDFDDQQWEPDNYYLTEFSTESLGAYQRVHEACEKFGKRHPDIVLTVCYRYENSWAPDGFIVEDGKLREITGHVSYTYDDDGESAKGL